jgi:hypothetical protein
MTCRGWGKNEDIVQAAHGRGKTDEMAAYLAKGAITQVFNTIKVLFESGGHAFASATGRQVEVRSVA